MRVLALILLLAPTAGADSGPTISVTGGQIRGLSLTNGAVFKGVPFAAPPEGELRWKPPLPVKPWSGVRETSEYGATCAQIDATWNKTAVAGGKEDCLFLNVWAPEWPARSKRPVMLWIHGGGNMGGSALGAGGIEPPFDGESLSRHGVVVVTISESKISNDMQSYWTNYAKSGDPNGAGLRAWPKYDTRARRYLEFTDDGPVSKESLCGAFCQLWTDLLNTKIAN